jgi:flavodoxin
MNNPVSPEDQQQPSAANTPSSQDSLLSYLTYWPAIAAGLLISMGILGLGFGRPNPFLVWIPLLVLGGLILVAIITFPRPKKHKEEPWEKRAREAALAAKATAQQQPEVSSAADAPTVTETSAVAPAAEAPKAAAAPVAAGDVDVLILWGSETGTAQGLAEMTENKLKDSGLSARAVSMGGITLEALPGFGKVLLITSTWGDGEPPSNAIDLWEAFQKRKVDLSNTRFSVLALGDTAYPQFCKCGKDFDEFLESQGAQRMHPRVDCDLDYEAPFEKWLSGIQKVIGS